MQIRLKTITGEEYPMDVEKSSQIAQFRLEVGSKLNVEGDRIRLIFAGQVLSDAEVIGKYEIADESVIHAVIRPVNAVPSPPATAQCPQSNTGPSNFIFTSGTIGGPQGNNRGANPSSATGHRSSSGTTEVEFGNGMGRFMVGSMSMSIEDMGGNGNSSPAVPPNMDAILSDIFGRSVADAAIANGDAARAGSQGNRAAAGLSPSNGRITVLRAKDQFGTSIESGLSNIRIISDGLQRSGTNQTAPILEEIEAREEDPSMAVAQMLSELGTCLGGLQKPLLKMSSEMQTGAFTQQCPSSSQRIVKLTEITNLKVALQNLTNASQHAARALALLTLESVPGVQPPLRAARPFAAAAAAAATTATAARSAATTTGTAATAAAAKTPTAVAAAGATNPVATAAKSTKLAKGFLNTKPAKKAVPAAVVGKSGDATDYSDTEDCNTLNKQVKTETAAVSPVKPVVKADAKPAVASKVAAKSTQPTQSQQQQQQGMPFPFPFPFPSPFCPYHDHDEHHCDHSDSEEEPDVDEGHARMAFFHMLRNSGPAGEFHMQQIVRAAQEREAEEKRIAKVAKKAAAKAKKESDLKKKQEIAKHAAAAEEKKNASAAATGVPLLPPTAAVPAVAGTPVVAGLAPPPFTFVSTPVPPAECGNPSKPPMHSKDTAANTIAETTMLAAVTASTSNSKVSEASSTFNKGNGWAVRGKAGAGSSIGQATYRGRKYNAARPMPTTTYVPAPAPTLAPAPAPTSAPFIVAAPAALVPGPVLDAAVPGLVLSASVYAAPTQTAPSAPASVKAGIMDGSATSSTTTAPALGLTLSSDPISKVDLTPTATSLSSIHIPVLRAAQQKSSSSPPLATPTPHTTTPTPAPTPSLVSSEALLSTPYTPPPTTAAVAPTIPAPTPTHTHTHTATPASTTIVTPVHITPAVRASELAAASVIIEGTGQGTDPTRSYKKVGDSAEAVTEVCGVGASTWSDIEEEIKTEIRQEHSEQCSAVVAASSSECQTVSIPLRTSASSEPPRPMSGSIILTAPIPAVSEVSAVVHPLSSAATPVGAEPPIAGVAVSSVMSGCTHQ